MVSNCRAYLANATRRGLYRFEEYQILKGDLQRLSIPMGDGYGMGIPIHQGQALKYYAEMRFTGR